MGVIRATFPAISFWPEGRLDATHGNTLIMEAPPLNGFTPDHFLPSKNVRFLAGVSVEHP
jgi:hypothetical protein